MLKLKWFIFTTSLLFSKYEACNIIINKQSLYHMIT
jgi:hypothetical protein